MEAREGKAHWFHLDVPRHLNHFTPATLRTALGGAGLRPRMVSYFASEYDFFSFVQTALNMLGLRHNLLYNLLRARGAKVLEGDQTAAPARDIALTLLLTPALGAISLVWVPVVALLKRGGTVTMYAKKPGLAATRAPTPCAALHSSDATCANRAAGQGAFAGRGSLML